MAECELKTKEDCIVWLEALGVILEMAACGIDDALQKRDCRVNDHEANISGKLEVLPRLL
jgi:hypothetical protein